MELFLLRNLRTVMCMRKCHKCLHGTSGRVVNGWNFKFWVNCPFKELICSFLDNFTQTLLIVKTFLAAGVEYVIEESMFYNLELLCGSIYIWSSESTTSSLILFIVSLRWLSLHHVTKHSISLCMDCSSGTFEWWYSLLCYLTDCELFQVWL